jgi:hypothetical protein
MVEIFPDGAGNARIYLLHFTPYRYKTRRAAHKKAHETHRVATSSRVKQLWLVVRFAGAAVEVIRDNEPSFSANLRTVLARLIPTAHLQPADVIPISALLRIPGPVAEN